MKILLSWLKEHLDTTANAIEIADTLTRIGLEVDSITNPAESIRDFRIAEIVDAERHPEADRLMLCKVNTGDEIVQVVCGDSNAQKGVRGVLGRPGMYVPGLDITLKETKIRGLESMGMFCSEAELGLAEKSSGIIILDPKAPVGQSYVEYKGLDDPVIEIELTPNKGDCLGHFGVARDLAAAGLGTLKEYNAPSIAHDFDSDFKIAIDLPEGASEACPLFQGLIISGVKNTQSPEWLKKKLNAVGLRPISALVDITNLMCHDLGRPMHVFDQDKLDGGLTVRLSQKKEELLALDEKKYTLEEGMTVISDRSQVCSLAGIMGGEHSGCTEETRNVVLESAYFDPKRTAITGRKLNINSDSRYRFERGVDPLAVRTGLLKAAALIQEICGGKLSQIISVGSEGHEHKIIQYNPEKVYSLCGLKVEHDQQVKILEKLGFTCKKNGAVYTVTVPSWRSDVDGENDLVEEILRIIGLDALPTLPLPRPHPEEEYYSDKKSKSLHKRQWVARRALASAGYSEAVTWSFVDEKSAELFGWYNPGLKLVNPISQDLNVMRPSLLPNLLQAIAKNAARGQFNINLFEVGPQYFDITPKGQETMVCGVRSQLHAERNWHDSLRREDLFDVKADVLNTLQAFGFDKDKFQISDKNCPDYYHPGRFGCVQLGPKNVLARFGEIHPRILEHYDLLGPVVAFEINLENLPLDKNKARKAPLTLSQYQPVERDFAFLLDHYIPAADVIRAVQKADKALISKVNIFDVYDGKGVPDGKKSIAISIRLEPQNATLTDEEIQNISKKVVDHVSHDVGGELRS